MCASLQHLLLYAPSATGRIPSSLTCRWRWRARSRSGIFSSRAVGSLRLSPIGQTFDSDPGDGPARLADGIREAIEIVALDRTGEVRVVSAALSALGTGSQILLSAELAGLISVTGDRVELVEPSVRQTLVDGLAPARRRQLHRMLADVLTHHRHHTQRAEHLASAAVGPDHEAASALAIVAAEATERGDAAGAGALFLRAADLFPDPEDRARHLYYAADGFWNAGDYATARAAFDGAYVGSTEPVLRADVALQLGQLDMYQRGPRFSRDLFTSAAAAVEPHDIDRAAMLLVHAASTVMLSSDVIGALVLARRACALAESGDGASIIPASLMLAFLSLQHGDRADFDRLFPPLGRIADELKDSDLPEIDLFLQLVGMIHIYTERWDAGRVYLSAVGHRAGRRARFATAALASATLAELCWRSGQWDEAWSLATGDLVQEVTLTGARLWLLAFTAHLEAGFGRADDCRHRAQAALAESEPMGFGTAIVWASHALGLLELGLGHPVAAAAHLDHVDAIATAYEMIEPNVLWWQADHVEALFRSGRAREAARALARFEAGGAMSQQRWAPAAAARCRGMMADSIDDAENFFATALLHHERLVAPFELGRTLLCRAERRVSAGADRDPTHDLDEAAAIFASLGAMSWFAQADALRQTIVARGDQQMADVLTPAEWRVAEAVATGMTNREVAAHLYVSEKTVEFHLHNVYRKLDVHSRTQLVRRLPQR